MEDMMKLNRLFNRNIEKSTADHFKWVKSQLLLSAFTPDFSEFIIENCYISGNSITCKVLAKDINDYDFYFKTKEAAEYFLKTYASKLVAASEKYTTNNAVTIQTWKTLVKTNFILQFITHVTGEPEEVTKQFDFEHVMNYYILKDETLVIKQTETEMGELKFNPNCSHPLSSLSRMVKFCGRGWKIDETEIIKIAMVVSQINFGDTKEVKEQARGLYSTSEYKQNEIIENILKFNTTLKQVHSKKFTEKVTDIVEND
jgi:hypothetical protein